MPQPSSNTWINHPQYVFEVVPKSGINVRKKKDIFYSSTLKRNRKEQKKLLDDEIKNSISQSAIIKNKNIDDFLFKKIFSFLFEFLSLEEL